MREMINKFINSLIFLWFLRITISALFLLSAIAKMYPSPEIGLIKFFESKQLIQGLGFNEVLAQYFSRSIIAFEFFLAFSILFSNYLKRLIIPAAMVLLVAFTSHLLYLVSQGSQGNCGCFGELIPMTPQEAVIKNVITLLMLLFIYKKIRVNLNSNFRSVVIVLLACTLFMFVYVPLRSSAPSSIPVKHKFILEDPSDELVDSSIADSSMVDKSIENIEVVRPEPPHVVSKYSQYIHDIDKGEKLLCFFVPGCEHCQLAAKQITELQRSIEDFPEVYIVFMDEEVDRIPEFFNVAGNNFTYQVMDIYSFMDIFWYDDNETPGIVYMHNGNILKFYQGSEDSGSTIFFNPESLEKILDNR